MKVLKAGTIKRIHVDRRRLAQNVRRGEDEAAWTIQTSKGPIKCVHWELTGKTSGDQRAKPLSCGARMYIETRAEVAYR